MGGVIAAGVGCVAYGVAIERRWYARRDERLPVLRGPGADGAGRLRVLLFSDLHIAPGQDHRLDYLRRVAIESQPDLIVSGGDNLEHPDAIEPVIEVHRDVLASTGAAGVAILGAHDRYAPRRVNPFNYLKEPSGGPTGRLLDTARLVKGLGESGFEVLENAGARVSTTSGPVDVVGVDDPHIQRDDIRVIGAFEPDPEAVLRLGLVHAPYRRALSAFATSGFDLTLAGHTHGGQLAVPGWGALVSNCDLPPRDAKGTSLVDGRMPLHVSAGLGHSIYYPIRFACRPEVSVLDLVPGPVGR